MTRIYKIVFLKLIIDPKRAFSAIDRNELFKYKYPLFILAGINNILARNWLETADVCNNIAFKLGQNIIIGALFGWLPLLFVSWLIYNSGKWLNGQSDPITISNVISYAVFFPVIISLISTLGSITFLRLHGFIKNEYLNSLDIQWHNTFYFIIKTHRYISWCVNLYYVSLAVIGISIIQGFTVAKAVVNVFVAVMIIVIPLLGIIALIPLLLH
jgi:hypothetical protein